MIIDASPLIIFGKINKLNLLKKIYKNIKITNSVYDEVVLKGMKKNIRDAFIIREHVDKKDIEILALNDKFSKVADKIKLIYRGL